MQLLTIYNACYKNTLQSICQGLYCFAYFALGREVKDSVFSDNEFVCLFVYVGLAVLELAV